MSKGLPFPEPYSTREGDTMLFRLKIIWGGFLSPSLENFSNVGPYRFLQNFKYTISAHCTITTAGRIDML